MKKTILAALIAFAGVHAQAHDYGYNDLLVRADIVRAFWSPCRLTSPQNDLELSEIEIYKSQGFELIAKIIMPAGNHPECQYTFVRKSALR